MLGVALHPVSNIIIPISFATARVESKKQLLVPRPNKFVSEEGYLVRINEISSN